MKKGRVRKRRSLERLAVGHDGFAHKIRPRPTRGQEHRDPRGPENGNEWFKAKRLVSEMFQMDV